MRVSSVSLSMFVLLIAAFCSGYTAQSQAQNGAKTGAKSDILGHWAAPDCARTEEAVTFTRSFYLKSGGSSLQLQRYAQSGTGPDHLILTVNGERQPVMRQEDGVLRTGRYAEKPQAGQNWDTLSLEAARDYTQCPETPDVIPKPLQRLTRYLDRIDESCSIKNNADCARVLFKAADDDSDGKLSPIEVQRAVVSVYLLSRLAGGDVLSGQAMDDAAMTAKSLAAAISDHVFGQQDKNTDGKLDYNESITHFTPPADPAFAAMISDIGRIFPAFSLAALKL